MKNSVKTALAALFTSSTLAAYGPLKTNSIDFIAIQENDSNGALARELKGQTGWAVKGEGENQAINFQLAMTVE